MGAKHESSDSAAVVVSARSGLDAGVARTSVPGHWTVQEALAALCQKPGQDQAAGKVIAQIQREISGRDLEYFAVRADGGLEIVNPKVRVQDIAVPQEIETAQGLQVINSAALAVQAYSAVGV